MLGTNAAPLRKVWGKGGLGANAGPGGRVKRAVVMDGPCLCPQ